MAFPIPPPEADGPTTPPAGPGSARPNEGEDENDLALRPPDTRWAEAALLARAAVGGIRNRRALRQVETFFLMLGYARSGSTLVGSLLDAHPDMVVAHEADILRYVRSGVSRSQLFAILLERDRQFGRIERQWHGFDYTVPGGFQGRFTTLRVIGDKHAGRATRALGHDPQLLERLRARVRVPIRVLHVTRNPFDNIASIAQSRGLALSPAIDVYVKLSSMADVVRGRLAAPELLDVSYESVVADPARRLAEICAFVGVRIPTRLPRCLRGPGRTPPAGSAAKCDLVAGRAPAGRRAHRGTPGAGRVLLRIRSVTVPVRLTGSTGRPARAGVPRARRAPRCAARTMPAAPPRRPPSRRPRAGWR